jgi:hypothetical protein
MLRRLERLAVLLDASILVPGTRFRFGLDPILGLFPGLGDFAGAALSGYIVYEAWRLGVPRWALVKMIANIGVEAAIGTVPVAGDVFDAAWKANLRNLDIVRRHVGPDARG